MTEEEYAAACRKAAAEMHAYVEKCLIIREEVLAAREGVSRRDRDRIERETGLVDEARRLGEAL